MNNKRVCMRCDELLFDIEIECEEEVKVSTDRAPAAVVPATTSTDKKA